MSIGKKQGSERTKGDLEGQDGVGRAYWKKLDTRKWATCRRVGFRPSEKNGAWEAHGWVFGSGALRKVADLLFALLMMWLVSEDIAGKVSGKYHRKNGKMLTLMRVFWPWYDWPESFGRWKRWPEWNTVTERIPGINYMGKSERIMFSLLTLIPCWRRERENLNSHSYC